MSAEPTYKELTGMVHDMKIQVASMRTAMDDEKKDHTAEDDKEKKDREAAFKQAKRAMKDEDKEKKAEDDDKEKVRDAFRKAEDEKDEDKKDEAMKKAMDEKDDYDKKHGKKAESEPNPKTEKKDPERDAKIASLENKYKEPLIEKILQATRIVDPSRVDMKLKQLSASSLTQVEEAWNDIKPFVAGYIPETKSITRGNMIPFQASAATDIGNTDIFSASVDSIDFSKVPTETIMEMYQ